MLPVKTSICPISAKEFKPSSFEADFCRKIGVPAPKICPEERLRRRLAYHNQIYVYRRTSSHTGRPMFAMYTEDAPFPVIEKELWWGDSWDASEHGRPYDFSKPFFSQFSKLSKVVPRFPLSIVRVENSEYVNNSTGLRNCYLVFGLEVEDSLHSVEIEFSRSCVDCTYVNNCELCFNCVMCNRCYNLQESFECDGCSDSFFLRNCRACADCFGCINLSHKLFYIYNKPYTEGAYKEFIAGLTLSSQQEREALRVQIDRFFSSYPRAAVSMSQVEDVSGNYIYESRQVHNSFFVRGSERLSNCFALRKANDCMDYTGWGNGAELVYESAICGNNIYDIKFCYQCFDNLAHLEYCQFCINCANCFGCVALRNKEYCVLNRQYSKQEYLELLPRIVAHMRSTGEYGEFFPLSESPIPYNNSQAQRYFPLEKEEAEKQRLAWYEREQERGAKVVQAADLPDALPKNDAPIVVASAKSGKAFRISTAEIQRYRMFNVPLPRTNYDERMEERAKLMGGLTLFSRECARSGKEITTSHGGDAVFPVWDREIFEQEAYE